mgnify:CR=1 FL=1
MFKLLLLGALAMGVVAGPMLWTAHVNAVTTAVEYNNEAWVKELFKECDRFNADGTNGDVEQMCENLTNWDRNQ